MGNIHAGKRDVIMLTVVYPGIFLGGGVNKFS